MGPLSFFALSNFEIEMGTCSSSHDAIPPLFLLLSSRSHHLEMKVHVAHVLCQELYVSDLLELLARVQEFLSLDQVLHPFLHVVFKVPLL